MTRADHASPPVACLVLLEDEEPRLQVLARPPVPRDGADAIAELAVLVAASGLHRAVVVIPSRMRDLVGDVVVARPLVVTKAERLADGRVELAVSMVTEDGSTPTPMDPARSPVSSLLYEALTATVDVPIAEAVEVLEGWGHRALSRPDLPPPDPAGLGRARYRLHRLAVEWSQRHRPMALAGQDRRPAAPVNLPVGFVPACPL